MVTTISYLSHEFETYFVNIIINYFVIVIVIIFVIFYYHHHFLKLSSWIQIFSIVINIFKMSLVKIAAFTEKIYQVKNGQPQIIL